jgi:hypothetical protein
VDPYKHFLSALEGVEAGRVRQCLECRRFFFALRKDQQACSRRCNSSRRVREWRENQTHYEYRRKLRGAGIETGKKRKRFTKQEMLVLSAGFGRVERSRQFKRCS